MNLHEDDLQGEDKILAPTQHHKAGKVAHTISEHLSREDRFLGAGMEGLANRAEGELGLGVSQIWGECFRPSVDTGYLDRKNQKIIRSRSSEYQRESPWEAWSNPGSLEGWILLRKQRGVTETVRRDQRHIKTVCQIPTSITIWYYQYQKHWADTYQNIYVCA